MISGITRLKNIQPPHDFYWRPVSPNFEGVDAIIRFGDDVWALQYTIGRKHKAATKGLVKIREDMDHKTDVTWHLVMVGSNLMDAKAVRDDQKLGDEWKWPTVVYASQLPMGQYNEYHPQSLLNEVSTQQLIECS